VPGDDTKDTGQQAHRRGRHLEPRKKLGQPKPYWPVEMEIENSLDLAPFVCGLDACAWRVCLLQHQ
jgi:hypothetical protein